jgi:hypothetical protein
MRLWRCRGIGTLEEVFETWWAVAGVTEGDWLVNVGDFLGHFGRCWSME